MLSLNSISVKEGQFYLTSSAIVGDFEDTVTRAGVRTHGVGTILRASSISSQSHKYSALI